MGRAHPLIGGPLLGRRSNPGCTASPLHGEPVRSGRYSSSSTEISSPDIYSHVVPSMKADATQLVADLIDGKR